MTPINSSSGGGGGTCSSIATTSNRLKMMMRKVVVLLLLAVAATIPTIPFVLSWQNMNSYHHFFPRNIINLRRSCRQSVAVQHPQLLDMSQRQHDPQRRERRRQRSLSFQQQRRGNNKNNNNNNPNSLQQQSYPSIGTSTSRQSQARSSSGAFRSSKLEKTSNTNTPRRRSSFQLSAVQFQDNGSNKNNNSNNNNSVVITQQEEQPLLVKNSKQLDTSIFVWLLPVINMICAFVFYKEIQATFHTIMDVASGHLWVNVDGNAYMSEIVKPVLNGPVTLSISILFGTLTSMTIQTLYRRQISLHQTLISTVEEVRELQYLCEGFPEPYKSQSHALCTKFLYRSFEHFERGGGGAGNNQISPESLRTYEMTQMLLLLNEITRIQNPPDIIICEAYGCVHRIKDRRAEFMSGLQTVFATAHYVVIALLASTLLFVFLLETDNDTLQFLLDFQLSICWSLLIGSYSMLAVIIYDLSNPFHGVFTTMKGINFVANERATEVIFDDDDDEEIEDNQNETEYDEDNMDKNDNYLGHNDEIIINHSNLVNHNDKNNKKDHLVVGKELQHIEQSDNKKTDH